MTVPNARLLAISAALLTPQLATAQIASRVEAGALITDAQGQSAIPENVWRLAPTASFRGNRGSVHGTTSAWIDNQNWQLVDGSIGGTLVGPTIYGVRAELIGNASRAFDERSLGTDQVDLQTRINIQFNKNSGAWLGGGVARPWRVMVVSSVDLFSGGAWVDLGSATLTSTVTSFSFSKITDSNGYGTIEPCPSTSSQATGIPGGSDPAPLAVSSSTSCNHRANVTDATVTGRWNLDRFELAGEAGHRMGQLGDVMRDSRNWASATLMMWVAPRAAILVGGGRQPSNPARGMSARNFGTVGMVLSYLSPSRSSVPLTPATALVRTFDVRGGDDGMQKIMVRVGGVESVDVTGDFSDWAPLTMVRRGRDLWELTVPLSPGMHQITIRTDGGKWVAPPGLPTTRDNFTGEVGVLIVKP
jgi:hypothetical protein